MLGTETATTFIFYSGVAAFACGAMLAARSRIEGPRRSDPRSVALVATGLTAIAIAVALFALGPRTVLPF